MGWGEPQHRLESTQETKSVQSPFPGHSAQKSSTYPPLVMLKYQDCGFSKWIRSQRVIFGTITHSTAHDSMDTRQSILFSINNSLVSSRPRVPHRCGASGHETT